MSPSTIFVALFAAIFLLDSRACASPLRDPTVPPWPQLLQNRTETLVEENAVAADLGADLVLKIQQNIVRNGRCDSRTCFAIDGSASVPPAAFEFQKDLVKLLAAFAALDDEAEFSAVQYGLANIDISLETSNITKFLARVGGAVQVNATRTFVSAGIGSCLRRIRRGSKETAEGTVIVLGDGRANFGLEFLDQVLNEVEKETIVSVGFGNFDRELLEKIASSEDGVFLLGEYANFEMIVYSLLKNMCTFSW
ncbi:unnamed protein product [Agarophyton chilense]